LDRELGGLQILSGRGDEEIRLWSSNPQLFTLMADELCKGELYECVSANGNS